LTDYAQHIVSALLLLLLLLQLLLSPTQPALHGMANSDTSSLSSCCMQHGMQLRTSEKGFVDFVYPPAFLTSAARLR
jgi:hypothetical protein